MKADLRSYLRSLARQGYQIDLTRSSHVRVLASDGTLLATSGSTPSDPRSLRNFKAQVKRAARTKGATR